MNQTRLAHHQPSEYYVNKPIGGHRAATPRAHDIAPLFVTEIHFITPPSLHDTKCRDFRYARSMNHYKTISLILHTARSR